MKYLVGVSSVTHARLDQVKIEERVELVVSSVWRNILGGVKKEKLDVEIEERSMYITKERCQEEEN